MTWRVRVGIRVKVSGGVDHDGVLIGAHNRQSDLANVSERPGGAAQLQGVHQCTCKPSAQGCMDARMQCGTHVRQRISVCVCVFACVRVN